MLDPVNPSPNDILEWAYDPDAMDPIGQDWDLVLSCSVFDSSDHAKTVMACASDQKCPSQRYMLGVLYIAVGDAVRTGFQTQARSNIENFIEQGDGDSHPDIVLWQKRSRELLKNPELFDYEAWCAGGLSREGSP